MGHMYALSIAWPLSVPSCPTPLPQPTGCQRVPTPGSWHLLGQLPRLLCLGYLCLKMPQTPHKAAHTAR